MREKRESDITIEWHFITWKAFQELDTTTKNYKINNLMFSCPVSSFITDRTDFKILKAKIDRETEKKKKNYREKHKQARERQRYRYTSRDADTERNVAGTEKIRERERERERLVDCLV